MTIKEIHDFIVFVLNKEASGYVSHEDIDSALDRAQLSKFTELYSNPKLNQPGRPIPPVAYGMNQKIVDDLRRFKMREQFTSTSTGIIDLTGLNKEYLHLLGAYVTKTINNTPTDLFQDPNHSSNPNPPGHFVHSIANNSSKTVERPIKIVNEDQLAERLVSQMVGPTSLSPIAILGDGGNKIQIFPESQFSGFIMYLCRPGKPLFSHAVDGRKIVHNPSTTDAATFTASSALTLVDGTQVQAGATYSLPASANLLWAEDCVNDIINKALQYLGVHIEDTNVIQYSETKNQQGL